MLLTIYFAKSTCDSLYVFKNITSSNSLKLYKVVLIFSHEHEQPSSALTLKVTFTLKQPGDSEGQGSLLCYSPWSLKGSDMTQQLNSSNKDVMLPRVLNPYLSLSLSLSYFLCFQVGGTNCLSNLMGTTSLKEVYFSVQVERLGRQGSLSLSGRQG